MRWRTRLSILAAVGLAMAPGPPAAGETACAPVPRLLEFGERIYRQGILPSGEPVTALINGDIPARGTQFTCVNCHQRSGRGSIEGWQVATPVTREALFGDNARRPAYRRETLAVAIRESLDPAGRRLASAMPAYRLDDCDMDALIRYIQTLSAEVSPGVTSEEIHFATVFNRDADSAGMLAVLEGYFAEKNAETRGETRRRNRTWLRDNRYMPYRKWVLHRWELSGEPDTWRGQLEGFYEQQPVFAMVSGMSTGAWWPVHEFCEENEIPCLLPNVDDPVIGGDDFYTLYFSGGHATEARVVAQHLLRAGRVTNVLQVHASTAAGAAAARALREALPAGGGPRVHDAVLAPGQRLGAADLRRAEERTAADAVVLWLPVDALAGAWPEASLPQASRVYLSSSFLDDDASAVPDALRARTFLVHPFTLPGEREKRFRRIAVWLERRGIEVSDPRVLGQTWFAAMILGEGLMHVRYDGYYRDFLLESIDHITERITPFSSHYARPSFGPGQRYLVKGCYVVDLSAPAGGDGATEWIVPR